MKRSLLSLMCAAVFSCAVFLGQSSIARGADNDLHVEPIADGLYAFRADDKRSFFLVGDDGVLVVDPLSASVANDLRAEIAAVTPLPVAHVVYAYSLHDRTPGAQIFKDDGAEIVAHERCAANIAETPHPDIVPPDVTFTETHSIDLGQRRLDLYDLGLHYDCSIVMIVRPENFLYVVGTVSPPAATVPTNPSTSNVFVYNLIPFLDSLEALAKQESVETMIADTVTYTTDDADNMIPLPPTGSATVIADQRQFWERLFSAAIEARAQGIGGSEVGRAIDHTPFKSMPGYDERNLAWITRRVQSVLVTGK